MAKSYLLIFLFVIAHQFFFAQGDSTLAPTTPLKKDSKWPYYGETVPPYLAITGAYEGLKTNNFQIGIVINSFRETVNPAVGGMVGGGLFYKQNTAAGNVRAYEAEIGIYGGITAGLNYNYNITTTNNISGFKPFVGIALYNVQVFYGYSFYRTKADLNHELLHNRITIRYVLPVLKL